MKIAICDDEISYRETILKYLSPYIEKDSSLEAKQFSNAEDLICAYKENERFDIIFLDIQMKSLDGIAAAKKIRKFDPDAILFFITSHVKFFSDAFRVNAFQFLAKPIKQDDFIKDFQRALEKYKMQHSAYIVKYKETTYTFETKNIIYIESLNRHLLS